MTERANTPKLRFPEFNTDWTTNQAKNLFTNVSDKKHDGDLLVLSATQDKGMVPRQDLDLEIKYDKKNLSNYKRTLPNDFIISLRSFQGGFELNTIEGIVSPAYTVLRGEEELVQSKFFKQYFKSIRFIKKLDSMIYGVRDGKSISYKEFSTFSINYPSILEQQKIGNFFSKLDRQIELEEEKLELLEQQKRGYMQKIFSQELRFKDDNGNDYPNWAVVKLKDILSERKEYANKTENYPHATLSTSGITLKSDRYNRDFLVKDKSKKYKVTIMNDICYNPANLKFGVITRNRIGSVIFSPIYITFEVNNGYSPLFIESLVTRNDFINRVRKYEEGTVYERMAVKPEDFLNYETEIPCLEEQKKIGDFLVEIDKLIEKQSEKIDFLKQRKQGLLQKMFV